MKIGSLFSGIGGFDLAARWLGWTTAWYSEVDPYCSAVMAHHFPEARPLGDITKIDWSTVEPVDLLCGGFPCQDVSQAGKRAGIAGARSGLWSEFARAIGDLRPRLVVVENVTGLFHRGFGTVLGDLAGLGYDAEWQVLSAADVGAPHLRKRVWIVAYPNGDRRESGDGWRVISNENRDDTIAIEGRSDEQPRISDGGSLAYPSCKHGQGLRALLGEGMAPQLRKTTTRCSGVGDGGWWAVEPDVGRVAHGVPNRVAQLRALGNAIVPQCAFRIFQAIQAAEDAIA